MSPSHSAGPRNWSSPSLALSSLLSIIIVVQVVACSPPVDYFVYTSQLATADQLGTTNGSIAAPVLPSLESIYSPEIKAGNDKQLEEMGKRVLELVRNSSHTHDNNQIDLEAAQYAWHLMEKQALLYTKNRIRTLKPFIHELLGLAKVSFQCQTAISSWLDGLTELQQWATLMWNSWGDFPPAGFFEGSFTDLGSYRGCMSVDDNEIIGQAQYCTLDFQPLVPTRPRFHSIFKRILGIDPASGQLTGGDFLVDKIGSHHSAHGFSSARFYGDHVSQSSQETTVSNLNKYSKRTIHHNGTEDTLTSELKQLEANSTNSNLTFKAEVSRAGASQLQWFACG